MTASSRSHRGKDEKSAKLRKRPKCPICGKPASPEYRPFCSKRCADIDLGRWLEGSYAVPGEPAALESDEED